MAAAKSEKYDPMVSLRDGAKRFGFTDGPGLARLRAGLGRPDLFGGVRTGAARSRVGLYRLSRVAAVAARLRAAARPEGRQPRDQTNTDPGPHGRRKVCTGCGRIFRSNKYDACPACRTGKENAEDPAGVMIKPRKQTRRCPDCGGELWEGQYRCAACSARRRQLDDDPGPWAEPYQVLADWA